MFHNKTETYTVAAAEDLRNLKFRVITLAGTLFNVASGNSGRAAGVNITQPNSGDPATYIYEGLVKAVAGATVTTLGHPLMVSSGGFLIAATSGAVHVGRAQAAAASGDLFPAFVDFKVAGMWGGT